MCSRRHRRAFARPFVSSMSLVKGEIAKSVILELRSFVRSVIRNTFYAFFTPPRFTREGGRLCAIQSSAFGRFPNHLISDSAAAGAATHILCGGIASDDSASEVLSFIAPEVLFLPLFSFAFFSRFLPPHRGKGATIFAAFQLPFNASRVRISALQNLEFVRVAARSVRP